MTEQSRLAGVLKSMGPGILFAGAAIGGSHLVQSTRAGADYGFELVWVVILANLFKYPFFEFAHRYTAATGESLLHGYRRMGRAALAAFLVLAVAAAIMNAAAVTLIAAGLLGLLSGWQLSAVWLSVIVVLVAGLILMVGQYATLDRVMKLMVALLGVTTIIAVSAAVAHGRVGDPGTQTPDIFTFAGFSFLIALMGWMPAPIDVSVWPSLWLLEREKQTKHKASMREALIDFHLGYGVTTLLALTFLSLGAMVMFGSGERFSPSGITFSGQLVDMYVTTLGGWSKWVIALLAFVTMFSTTLTVMDGYTRTLRGSISLLWPRLIRRPMVAYWLIIVVLFAIALVIIGQYLSAMTGLLDLATVLAFLAAPALAYLNYRAVTMAHVPLALRPAPWLKALAFAGMAFLSLFTLLYIGWRLWGG